MSQLDEDGNRYYGELCPQCGNVLCDCECDDDKCPRCNRWIPNCQCRAIAGAIKGKVTT